MLCAVGGWNRPQSWQVAGPVVYEGSVIEHIADGVVSLIRVVFFIDVIFVEVIEHIDAFISMQQFSVVMKG